MLRISRGASPRLETISLFSCHYRGGSFILKNGIKDCSNCITPHAEEGYDYILAVVTGTVYKKDDL
jgi:Zn-finger protein